MIAGNVWLVAAVCVAAVGAWYDWRTGHIPNWVTLGPLVVAPVVHFFADVGDPHGGKGAASLGAHATAAGFSVVGALVCVLVPFFLYMRGGIGGGDVKLLAALGAMLRTMVGIESELYAFIAMALFAPARLAWEGKLLRTLGNTVALVANPFLPAARRRTLTPEMMTELRFGPAIFVGALIAAFMHWSVRRR